jgi:hypothetical protein
MILLMMKRVKQFYLRRNCTRWFAFLIGVVIITLLYMVPVIGTRQGMEEASRKCGLCPEIPSTTCIRTGCRVHS